ncbi:response regulator transcription factor [Sinorhizobium medicae]|uniref:Two-component response regulator n=1 Tax=Sinorhizobium medicae TaxID=110321 RepID=A0A508X8X3_9HYPH|nr:response regulator [Sinorhizobium medicae]VTZ65434.1 Two-component response regulator [Sinorhizobium medicae]
MIAVVDDDPFVRDGLKNLLLSIDHNATTFESAEDFLETADKDSVTCVVADVRMGGISGIEMQDCLKSTGFSAPIIFLTAHCDDATRIRALSGGAFAFLCKPFDEDELLASIGSALASIQRI